MNAVTWEDVIKAADEMNSADPDEYEYRHRIWKQTLADYQKQQKENAQNDRNTG